MTLYVMDTDLLSLHQRGHPQLSNRISLARANGIIIKTTAITVEEQYTGRLAQIRKAKTPEVLVAAYDRLIATVSFFSELEILPYNLFADNSFRQFRQKGIRIGTQDLRIASITLAHNGIVITRNRKDFEQVPGLTIEDWSL
jgi:tRNA(fMet)-specific endonuclease VapC